ncbi:MAG: phosphoenolpyruvate synthase regulatory protein [Burkholderiales bacterium]|jgi:regulator of PEP synthase PpsR (kinase-PPPase family)|nr:phosphoenolpyruvate synthase regulatory protein [Burkholderiales bacterium]
MADKRTAFFISDRTGITAEMLGHTLLTQFESVGFEEVTLPFVDSVDKARDVVNQINALAEKDGVRPIVISTLVNTDIAEVVRAANALFLDCFDIFISPLEKELGARASHAIGRSHSVNDFVNYHHRIESVNYTLSHDDGVSMHDISQADVILVGVSRCGKTPTCLYLAMQYGVRAANYPLVADDFAAKQLPPHLRPLRPRLYGLTIRPERLQQIRNERRPGSKYATLANCEFEVREAEALMQREEVRILDVTTKSVEELATTILHQAKLVRRIY